MSSGNIKKWHSFFRTQLKHGYSFEQIREILLKLGFQSEAIDFLIRDFKESEEKNRRKMILASVTVFFLLVAVSSLFFHRQTPTGMATYEGNTYYVDATNGNDYNDGLSPDKSIKTIRRVNTLSLNPGDSVLFKRGELWNFAGDSYLKLKNGAESRYISYGAYGDGDLPRWIGGNLSLKESDWNEIRPNVWKYYYSPNWEVGNIIFKVSPGFKVIEESSFGIRNWSVDDLHEQGHYYSNKTSKELFLYSLGNPVTYYGNMLLIFRNSIIVQKMSWVKVSNISIEYTANIGFEMQDQAHHIILRDCDFSYIGGGYYSTGQQRLGNAIQTWRNSTDILVENNRIWETYDAGFTTQGSSGTDFQAKDIIFRNNVVWNSAYCFEFFQGDPESSVENLLVDHNTCYNLGEGWYKSQRVNTIYGRCYRIGGYNDTKGLRITNNICFKADEYVLGAGEAAEDWQDDNTIYLDYNLYYRDTSQGRTPYYVMWLPEPVKGDKFYTLEEYISLTGKDKNSRTGDPLFIDVSNLNFRPTPGSIACSMSSTGSYVGALPCEGQEESPVLYCGDKSCNNGETCSSCAGDCGICPAEEEPTPFCGDSACNNGESCSSCPQDCGQCPAEEQNDEKEEDEPKPERRSGGGGGSGSSSTSHVILEKPEDTKEEQENISLVENNTLEMNSSVFESNSEGLNDTELYEKEIIIEKPAKINHTLVIQKEVFLYFIVLMISLGIASFFLLKGGKNTSEEEILQLIRKNKPFETNNNFEDAKISKK